jgi:hypothetical protein
MTKYNLTASRASKIFYWIATIWLALGMVSTGIVQLIKTQEEIDMMTHLGYPIYLLTLLGILKILGVVVVLIPGFLILKEWAYAGFFFAMSGAIISHIVVSDGLSEISPPFLLLILTMLSWYFRPPARKTASQSPPNHNFSTVYQ